MNGDRRSREGIAPPGRLARRYLAASLILPLVACASARQWERPATTGYETENDLEACRAAARKEAPDLSVPGRPQFGTVRIPGAAGGRGTVMVLPAPPSAEARSFDAEVRQRQLSDDCMKARGYHAAAR